MHSPPGDPSLVTNGDAVGIQIDLTNGGTAMKNFAISFSQGDWIGEHVIQSSDPQYTKKSILGDKYLTFGPVAADSKFTVTIDALTTKVGNNDYSLELWDFEGEGDLRSVKDPQGNNEARFSETVNP